MLGYRSLVSQVGNEVSRIARLGHEVPELAEDLFIYEQRFRQAARLEAP